MHPEQSNIEDTVSNEAGQVESQEVKVETYNAENTHVGIIRHFALHFVACPANLVYFLLLIT